MRKELQSVYFDEDRAHFRQVLLWPMQLTPIREDAPIQEHWELLQATNPGNPWREVIDEFMGDTRQFLERHYSEFAMFLPYVQRFLNGEGKRTNSDAREDSALRVFRRDDIAKV